MKLRMRPFRVRVRIRKRAGSVLPYDAIPIRALAALVAYSPSTPGCTHPADAIGGALIGAALAQATTRTLDRWQGAHGA